MIRRRIFNYDDISKSTVNRASYKNKISAGGCLFYKIVSNEVKLLLIKYNDETNKKELEDFGGKFEEKDSSLIDGIMREVSEETNNLINEDIIYNELKQNLNEINIFYNKTSYYYLILIKVDDNFFTDTLVFGDIELHNNIKRVIIWYDYNPKNISELHPRLSNNKELIEYINSKITISK